MLARALVGATLLAGPAFAAEPSRERVYIANCSACHQRNGQGIPEAFPTLAGDALVQGDPQRLVALLLNGRGGMPAFRTQLNDSEIAAVATYVRGAWGNDADPVPAAMATQARTGVGVATAEPGLQAH